MAKSQQPFYHLLPPGHDKRKKRWLPSGFEGGLFWDHPETCWIGGIPVAVVHLYRPLSVSEVPEGLIVDELPASWYFPHSTTAYVYRPERIYLPKSTGLIREHLDAGAE